MPHVSLISLLLFMSVISMNVAGPAKRTLHFEEKCKNQNWTTMYLRADGFNDTLHYIWDFGGKPSILMALTSLPATLNITCENFLHKQNNSIVFSEKPIYTIGIIINKIIEFNDVNNTAVINFTNATNINVLKPESFVWSRKSFSMDDDSFGLNMEANFYNDTTTNIIRHGSIKATLKGYYFMEHTDSIPHMLHTENSMLVDLIFDNIETNETFTNSRFAVELMIVGGGNPDKLMIIDPKKNLDDEHTPGIFEVIEVRTPAFNRNNETQENSAYLQWRPISYVSSSRSVSSSTEIVQYPPSKVNNRVGAINNSMLYCYYGENVDNLLVQTIMISVGSKDDGFYKSTRYTTWTFIIGYGTPPDEQLSYLVILIISIGLGLPIVIIFLAALYVCIRNMSKRRHNDTYLNR
ncbi:PREDICTED: glycosylated lysosomal membrane protein A-like [Polistes dominula]|uniref:Glycosylated lysosomal membrane protein A-like n=1 Tax=Polistes dominula TaxID=743375 RepID=A0ABM1IY79_POLDO|nr:PREDICTED: glycosylated lysosomal membrane protein A-like [Polistes dominula]